MDGIKKLLRTAIQYKASDLYISSGSKPVLRVNGELHIVEEHPAFEKKVAEAYLLEVMDQRLRDRLQKTSDLDFSIEVEGIARFRVNIFVQRQGISGVFRVIPAKAMTIDELKLSDQIKTLADLKQGLVLLTGPTGCGKSSTLASIIREINEKQKKHIITIEDPIEFIHENQQSVIQQREVGTHTVSFERALRAALREDPDVILIGEMRDLETIALAITAAETGHLVLATLHTQGAANSIDRIIDVFPSNQQAQVKTQLAATLQAIIWQQLLPTEVEMVNGTKRIAALEILRNNHAIKNLIRKGQTHQIDSVIETGRQEGMQTMEHALKVLFEEKIISEETYHEYIPEKTEV
ncbi:MAG: type IV pilus twitching motility protein PilT [Candidatus Peregrinibacteria bacterium]|nr:type IV pilus twitching motility protein PilT [Candidatus Peregrinibacteria bacterium]